MYSNDKLRQQELLNYSVVRCVMDEKNPVMLDILNYLIYLSTRFSTVFPCQDTIAKKFGVSRQWVSRLLRRWQKMGVIKYRQRGLNMSCLYMLSPLLNLHKLRLRYKLPAAALLFSVSALLSSIWQREFTLSNIRKLYRWKMVEVPAVDYGFYQPKQNKTFVLIEQTTAKRPRQSFWDPLGSSQNRSAAIFYVSETKKREIVMDKNTTRAFPSSQSGVRNLIAQAYGLSTAQENMLAKYSDAALEHAVKALSKLPDRSSINSPVSWLASVASKFDLEAILPPKTGKTVAIYQPELPHIVGEPGYEEHLDKISADKSDPLAYKQFLHRYNQRRVAR